MFVSLLLTAALASPAQEPELPLIEVTGPMTIAESCILQIAEGAVFPDPDGTGVLRVEGKNLTIRFASGSVLRGATAEQAQNRRMGVGIRAEKAPGLILQQAQVTGYRTAIVLNQCDGAMVEGAKLWGNFAQRLASSAAREATADWLYPHHNDDQEWERHGGAGISVHRSREVILRGNTVRAQQNGILFDRVQASQVYDNDASFLSGWGLAMWRSSDNLISRNAFDYCIRGYSHGVYNRGQDSAGILMFEQCSRNTIVENSVTHGGDGLFAFAGEEALGKVESPKGFSHRRAGNNENIIVGNDFSYAAAHGLELTFSFGNWIAENHFERNAICGIWGGFSQELQVWNNTFVANGDAGYGLERGGINVDHPRSLWVLDNDFREDHCGVHLWRFPGAFAELPWGKANALQSKEVLLAGNTFATQGPAIHLRGKLEVLLANNELIGPGAKIEKEDPALASPVKASASVLSKAKEQRLQAAKLVQQAREQALGESKPIGARREYAGRDSIRLDAWGPWDHAQPSLFFTGTREDGAHGYVLLPASARVEEMAVTGEVNFRPEFSADGPAKFWITADELGMEAYTLEVRADGIPLQAEGLFVTADWRILVFPLVTDPREEGDSWRQAAASEEAQEFRTKELQLAMGSGSIHDLLGGAGLPADQFGILARAGLRLSRGKWRIKIRSDDGMRFYLDGELKLEDWTHHASKEAVFEIRLAQPQSLPLRIEYFELDGAAHLSLEVEKVE